MSLFFLVLFVKKNHGSSLKEEEPLETTLVKELEKVVYPAEDTIFEVQEEKLKSIEENLAEKIKNLEEKIDRIEEENKHFKYAYAYSIMFSYLYYKLY